jgi:HlyD family secretion protein
MQKLVLVTIGLVTIGLVGIALTAAGAVHDADEAAERNLLPAYQLAEVTRGEVTTTVVAAGKVQPVVNVDVSSQVSGQVKEILVDYNDTVTQEQPIARLDPQLFATRVEQARAEVEVTNEAVSIARDQLAAAEVTVNRAGAERAKTEAEAKRSEVAVDNARRRLDRKSVLMKSGSNSVSEADVDEARTVYNMALAEFSSATAHVAARAAAVEEAKAQLAVARSRVAYSEARVRSGVAALRQAEANLDRTVIRAPMDGVVLDRSVAVGQTVAASLQAPTLFKIGDLRAVHVETAIDEADVGLIRIGQPATFSVDAYPDKVFAGHITQLRKAPHEEESVVTYTALVAADNDDLLLLPGMTTKVDITIGKSSDALQVPTAALRYQPEGVQQPSGPHVWVLDGESLRSVAVQVGIDHGGATEVVGNLSEGQKVVISNAAGMTGDTPGLTWQRLGVRVSTWMEPMQAAVTGMPKR